jgi:hypothetical protein
MEEYIKGRVAIEQLGFLAFNFCPRTFRKESSHTTMLVNQFLQVML